MILSNLPRVSKHYSSRDFTWRRPALTHTSVGVYPFGLGVVKLEDVLPPPASVGLALRCEASIYVAEAVLEKAGQWITAQDEDRLKDLREKMRTINPEDFGNYKM